MSSAEADNHRNSISPSASALKAHLDGVEDLEVNNTANSIHQGESMLVTEQDSRQICRKTDKTILVVLVWIYFLQVLDKSVLGYASLFGLQEDTGLVGSQYSLVGSIAAIAQLCALPFSSFLMVRVPHRTLMCVLVFGWGVAQTCMAASHNYGQLLVTRFFLGLFEACCLPLFSVITSQWYRRSEQPLRVAAWYGSNGLATMVGSALSFGLGHVDSPVLKSWQIIFLFVGLVTVVTPAFIWWRLDNDIESARFLTGHEKLQAVERLRANNTGIGNRHFKWDHVIEVFLDPKTYLWFAMALLLNVGAGVANIFGPLILAGLGYDKYITSILNIPFGAVELLVIVASSFAAHKAKLKGIVLGLLMLPVVVGLVVLYTVPRTKIAVNLVAYYLLAFIYGGNPLLVTWLVGNTAGTTKKTVLMVLFNIGVSTGNIIGPLMFSADNAPSYLPGLRACVGIFVAMVAIVLAQWTLLFVMNKRLERKRVANGKPAKVFDRSMTNEYMADDGFDSGGSMSGVARLDTTDRKNEDFVYIY